MVLQSHTEALFPWALPILSYTEWLTGVPQILFQRSGLFLFLIKENIISKTFLGPKASEYSLNVYFLDLN